MVATAKLQGLRCLSDGSGDWNQVPRVAVVGSRRADPEACHFAFTLGRALAAAGVAVVSGGALGIDAAVHRGALAAGSNARTLAVIGSGLNRLYPKENIELFREIARRGALLSHVADDAPPLPHLFLERNWLIAALATAVVVVQAPVRSGALSTARAARELGCALWTCPAAPWDIRGQGNVQLLTRGARPLTEPAVLLEALGMASGSIDSASKKDAASANPRKKRGTKSKSRAPGCGWPAGLSEAHPGAQVTLDARVCRPNQSGADEARSLSDIARQVRDALSPACRSASEVSQRTALPIARCLAALSELELAGYIRQYAPGAYART